MLGTSLDTEVAVVGAGPAGARAAQLLAAAGARVLVLDPRVPWEKPCGGGLTQSVFRELPELRELDSMTRPIRRLRVETGLDRGFTVMLEHPIRIVSRRELGRWQLERTLEAGAIHIRERVRSIRRMAGRWRIETGRCVVTADLLVGADGAASRVRPFVAPRVRVELDPTRLFLVPGPGPTPEDMLLRFVPGVTGYVWDFPRPDHRSVGIVVGPGEWQRPRMDREVEVFRRSVEVCPRTDEGTERTGAVIGTAEFGHGDWAWVGGRDFALLGDAAGLADPATGEGIRNALRSAGMLAQAWKFDGTFEAYPRLARKGFESEFRLSRAFRRVFFDAGAGMAIIDAGRRSDAVLALVSAVMGGMNEHDVSLPGLARRWWRARSEVRRDPRATRREARAPVPCPPGCGCHRPGSAETGTGPEGAPGAGCAA